MRRLFILGVLVSTGLLSACSSDSAGTGATGGAGGAAGQPAGGAGGHAAVGGGGGGQAAGGGGGTAAGGAGGLAAGGAGGQALGGAGGGATVVCLDAATFASSFAIADSTFCAVALYTAPESIGYQIPTWGRHGGPLLVQPGASGAAGSSGKDLTLERWTPPAGATGAMTLQATTIASALPTGTYLGAQAVDLPFFGWTAISWVDAYPMTTGQIEMVASGAVATTFDVNGPYALVAVPAASSLGRLLYSGLSPLGMPTTKTNGLYQADACSSPAPALGAGTGCSAPGLVSAWGDNSGPVAADSDGDLFAVMATSAGNQARAFAASSVARGAGPTDGVPLFTIAGYSGALAALSPTATDPGRVLFQPSDSSFTPLDVVQQQFTTSGGSLTTVGTPTAFLTVATGQSVSLLADDAQRLWVAISGTSSTTYVVLARH